MQWSQELLQMTCRNARRRIFAWLVVGLAGLSGMKPSTLLGQVSGQESARKLKAGPGLEATLWASEPMLANPTNIDIDSRGRVWVTEGLNYRLSRGRNGRFQRDEQADRIKILEDTDGDGKADKVTVFAEKIFPVPMGIAVEEHYDTVGKYTGCRVFVGNSPDLLVFEDTDGDDKADKRHPLLTGFGGIDSDHGVHGMVLGADGKLYFTHGDGCCSVQHDHSERQQNFDVIDKGGRHVWTDQLANTLRVNRDGTQFEIICDRQRNNYETSLNSFGNIFTSDNDDDGNRGCRVIWAMDGGHYGYHTPGSARHWGEEVPGNAPKLVGTGNGSPCGIMVYEGDLLPPEYRGAVLEVDAGTRQVNLFPLTRKGASFRTVYKVFLSGDDPWFRPVDACTAPDGSVFVADWYDAGVGGHAFSDQTTGRIYRVAPSGHVSRKVAPDMRTPEGLILALKSPNIATQDVARRLLIDRVNLSQGQTSNGRIVISGRAEWEAIWKLVEQHDQDTERARAAWTLYGIALRAHAVEDVVARFLKDDDPRFREMAVRMLGRDCRENGKVEYSKPEAKHAAVALRHLKILKPMSEDLDAGVRRELILAFRNLPTSEIGNSLQRLTALWDGQDRWYLEALGLALEKRESDFLSMLFDGSLFGTFDQKKEGIRGEVALPPYFPVDRNEAFLVAGRPDHPVSSISKYLGLAWRIHRREVLPLIERLLPDLQAVGLQQAADDILEQMSDPQTADLVAKTIYRSVDRAHQRALLALLARRLTSAWHSASDRPAVIKVIEQALADPETRRTGIMLAMATRDRRYQKSLTSLAEDPKTPEDIRIAAIEGFGSFPDSPVELLEQFIESVRGKANTNPLAEAALRTISSTNNNGKRLLDVLTVPDYPIGLRREALRTLARRQDGGEQILNLATTGTLPADLKNDATTLVHTDPNRRIRDQGAKILPLPKTASGEILPPLGELIRREGNSERGKGVFFREGANSCAGCHRVQGQGQWVGPDLSTIGIKYGRTELIRSILSPSDSIGYSYRSLVVALADGRVITGLAVEDTPEKLVIKTADGQRVSVEPHSVEDRRTSDISLMPEGLAQTMTTQEVVDLLAYLSTLRRPVSIVGEYQAIGPLYEPNGMKLIDPTSLPELRSPVADGQGQHLSWRRLATNVEGQADLSLVTVGDSKHVAYVLIPVTSPVGQQARVVIDTPAKAQAWFNGKPLTFSGGSRDQGLSTVALIDLPLGSSTLLFRLIRDEPTPALARLVTTIVSDQPIGFELNAAALSSGESGRR
jgi:putative membrane-bound dehydrogenase-like protein